MNRSPNPWRPNQKEMTSIRIGLSLGDPGGIGPEIVIKAAASWRSAYPGHSLIIFGDRGTIQNESEAMGVPLAAEDCRPRANPGPASISNMSPAAPTRC